MKKMILAVAVLASFQPAFAQDLSAQDMSAAQTQEIRGDGDAIAGAIIGGVIGGIIGGAIGNGGHGNGHNRPRPFPGNDRQVVCYARNARGQVFRAFGWGERRTQSEAMDKCERSSRFCRPVGCQG